MPEACGETRSVREFVRSHAVEYAEYTVNGQVRSNSHIEGSTASSASAAGRSEAFRCNFPGFSLDRSGVAVKNEATRSKTHGESDE